jgi:rhodanese-related sulfurtransferase
MNVLAQLAVIGGLSVAAAGITGWIRGAPVRQVQCDPAALKPDEVCLATVLGDWNGEVLWVDARPRSEWEANGVKESRLWNLDPAEDMNQFAADLAPELIENPRVVIYCGDESCGVSRQVAEAMGGLGLGGRIHVLFGGWRALEGSELLKDSSGTP